MSRSLVIVRAGRKSLHNGWVDCGKARMWDLYVCPYEAVPYQSDQTSQIVVGEIISGPKWSGLSQLFRRWEGWRDYDHIMLADDDLFAIPSVWSRFFEIVKEQNVALSQPALSRGSYFSHIITCQNTNFIYRTTTFVEIMMPCFRADVLEAIIPSFDLNKTGWGWGLDFLWPHLLNNQTIMIVDETPILHTRPVGSMTDLHLKEKIVAEMNEILALSNQPMLLRSTGGLAQDSRILTCRDPDFMRLYIAGYWDKIRDNPALFANALQSYLQ